MKNQVCSAKALLIKRLFIVFISLIPLIALIIYRTVSPSQITLHSIKNPPATMKFFKGVGFEQDKNLFYIHKTLVPKTKNLYLCIEYAFISGIGECGNKKWLKSIRKIKMNLNGEYYEVRLKEKAIGPYFSFYAENRQVPDCWVYDKHIPSCRTYDGVELKSFGVNLECISRSPHDNLVFRGPYFEQIEEKEE